MSAVKLNSAIRILTGLIGLALFGYFVLFFVREATKMSGWQKSGELWSETKLTADSLIVFTRIEPTDFISGVTPQIGDTLVSLNDNAVTIAHMSSYFDTLRAPGLEVPIGFRHAGTLAHAVVKTRPPPGSIYILEMVLQVLRFLIAGLSIGVGLWAFFARPDSAGVRALAFFSFSMGAFIISGVTVNSASFAAFNIPYINGINNCMMLLFSFFGGFWLNLQMLFPRPLKFVRERPVIAYSLCYAPMLLVITAVSLIAIISHPTKQLALYGLAVNLLQIIVGMILLAVRYKRAQDRLERRQTRLVLLGSGLSLALLILMITFAGIFPKAVPGGQIGLLVLINTSFCVLLLSPLSFLYAFGRYRLLDVEGKLRRGTRYVITAGVFLALLIGAAYAALQRTLQTGDTTSMLLMLGLAMAIVPATKAGQKVLEKRFYPERERLRLMIHDFLEHALSIPDKETFWSELEVRLRDGLRVERVHPVLLVSGNGHYSSMVVGVTPFTTQSVFLERLAREHRPVLVDEVIASERVNLTAEEALWLQSQHVGLVLPLVSHSSLIGFLGLGQKTEREDYAAEELRILDSLSPQIALASENIRLLEDNIVKRQLEEQLQIARRIQQGFLPQEIPATQGLEIAAASRFCLDVAGDYYDVIPLENGRTVLAVGDVSGKGAGAALLMANLQASLRTAVGMGNALDDVVSRINDLIFRNTPPEQYITFFVAVFDATAGSLTYVNAGHNPPMLVHSDGQTKFLDQGGVILGFAHGMDYAQEVVALNSADMMIMYTDGVSEAMDESENEFGEDRICEYVCANRSQPMQQILSSLENEVVAFRGDLPFEDDFTLLLVRVI